MRLLRKAPLRRGFLEDFDRLDGRNVAESIADWLEQETRRPVRYEKVKPGDEQVLPDPEQRS
jgi:hypothetical protein